MIARRTIAWAVAVLIPAAVLALATFSIPCSGADDDFDLPVLDLQDPPLADLDEAVPLSEALDQEIVQTDVATEVFRERYPNRHVKVEREVTLDTDGNYVNHGKWKMWGPTGTVVAEGQYNMGKQVGNWTRYLTRKESPVLSQFPFNQFKPPFVSHASYTDGVLDGDWVIFDADQKKCKHVPFKNGKRHGMAITWLPNGKMLRQASFDNGLPVGDVVQVEVKTGKPKKVATYVDGRQVFTKATHYKSGRQKKTEAVYLAPITVETEPDDFWSCRFAQYDAKGKALRHGPSEAWYTNGQSRVKGQYDRDKQVGQFTFWHPNGQKAAEGEFKSGQVHGPWVWWHANGQKATVGGFRDGKLVGKWRWWAENGRLTNQLVHDGTKTFSPDKMGPEAIARQPEKKAPSR